MSIEFKHPDGNVDVTDHEHDWQIPVESGHLGSPTENYKLRDALVSWCNLCGAIGWGRNYKTIIYPAGVQSRTEAQFVAGYHQAAKDTLEEAAECFSAAAIFNDPKYRDEVDFKAKILRNWSTTLMKYEGKKDEPTEE